MNGASGPTLRELASRGSVHFMGAGGAGMSALAEALHRAGATVTACDREPGSGARALEALGIRVDTGHDPGHLEGAGALVVTAAVPADHPELARARELGIPVLKRARALGEWVSGGKVAAVAGTHGKTTTTALLATILEHAGMDPTAFVGGEVPRWKSNLRPGRDDLFVVEADEYDRSFHHLAPDVTVVTNVEADHLDIFGTEAGVREAFVRYLEGVRPGGAVWGCADDGGSARLLAANPGPGRTHSYGMNPGAELRGEDPVFEPGGASLRVRERGLDRGRIRTRLAGMHNLRNLLGAAGAARTLGASWEAIRAGAEAFGGVRRRFEFLGEIGGVRVVDDYAHHPTEVAAALAAARARAPERRLVAVFQPHLYSRTRDFHRAFGEALSAADVAWVTAIYPAREEPIAGVDAGLVAAAARASGAPGVVEHPELSTLAAAIAGAVQPGDLVLTLGAGSVDRVGPELLRILGSKGPNGAGTGTGGSHA